MTLLKCPDCREPLSDTASACAHCGLTVTPDFAKQLKAQHESVVNSFENVLIIAGLGFMGAVILLTAISSNAAPTTGNASQSSTSRTEHRRPTRTTAQKMAVLEAQSLSGADDVRLASSMDRRLRRLADKFPETEVQIAAMTVKTQKLLEKRGISRSLGQVMDDIDYVLPSSGLSISYAECAAMYVTLTDR